MLADLMTWAYFDLSKKKALKIHILNSSTFKKHSKKIPKD